MMSEAQEQCKLIKWADKCVQMKIHPEFQCCTLFQMVAEEIKPKPHILKGKGLGQVFRIYALLCQKVNITAYILSLKSATIRLLNIRINGCRIFHGADTP